MKVSLAEAARTILTGEGRPIVSTPNLLDLLTQLYRGTHPSLINVRTKKATPSDADLAQAIQRLKNARVVRDDPDFGPGIFQVFDVLQQSAEDVCCTVDTLCYVSHLAAMQLHGLTSRNPVELTFTRPADPVWREEMRARDTPAPPRSRRNIPAQVRGRAVLVHETRHPGASEHAGPIVRVATIGQTFLDMVVRPAWCGGMAHVLEVWQSEAPFHLEDIIAAIQTSPAKLPMVRAGYILDEVIGISDPRISAWLSHAQRGSSQKLDPEQPYAPTFSERWMLSLNA